MPTRADQSDHSALAGPVVERALGNELGDVCETCFALRPTCGSSCSSERRNSSMADRPTPALEPQTPRQYQTELFLEARKRNVSDCCGPIAPALYHLRVATLFRFHSAPHSQCRCRLSLISTQARPPSALISMLCPWFDVPCGLACQRNQSHVRHTEKLVSLFASLRACLSTYMPRCSISSSC